MGKIEKTEEKKLKWKVKAEICNVSIKLIHVHVTSFLTRVHRGVKTGYPARDGLAHVGIGLSRAGAKKARIINMHKYSCPSPTLCGSRAFGPTQLKKKINFKNKNDLKLFTPHIVFFPNNST